METSMGGVWERRIQPEGTARAKAPKLLINREAEAERSKGRPNSMREEQGGQILWVSHDSMATVIWEVCCPWYIHVSGLGAYCQPEH